MGVNGRFEKLNDYMGEILISLVESDNLSKLIYYNTEDALRQLSLSNPYQLIHTKVFPYTYVPPTDDEANVYLTVSFRQFKKYNSSFKIGYLYVNILCHKNLVSIYEGSRIYSMMNEVENVLNEKRIAIGKLLFDYGDELTVSDSYTGYFLRYEICDLN
jgi:hypothetical protein